MDPRTARMLEERTTPTAPRLQVSPALTDWVSANWFRASFALAALVLAVSIGTYLLIVLPGEARAQAQAKQQQEIDRATDDLARLQCLADADSNYHAGWKSECESRSLGDDCSLPSNIAKSEDDRRREARDECFKQYPAR